MFRVPKSSFLWNFYILFLHFWTPILIFSGHVHPKVNPYLSSNKKCQLVPVLVEKKSVIRSFRAFCPNSSWNSCVHLFNVYSSALFVLFFSLLWVLHMYFLIPCTRKDIFDLIWFEPYFGVGSIQTSQLVPYFGVGSVLQYKLPNLHRTLAWVQYKLPNLYRTLK